MFGPDGKPLMFTQGRIIGGPKGTEDFPPLDEAGVKAFLDSVEQTVAQVISVGQPLDIPCAALPPASLAHLAQTIRAFQARIKDLEEEVKALKAPKALTAENGEAPEAPKTEPRKTTLLTSSGSRFSVWED